MTLQEWEGGSRDGRISEAFATGTAAPVVPVSQVVTDGRNWTVGDGGPGPVMSRLREELDIQYGGARDEFGWMHGVGTSGDVVGAGR